MKRKPFWEMNARELARATRLFDIPLVIARSRALTTQEQRTWQRLRKKRGRPRHGRGFQRISVSMEKGLLEQVTALAKKHGVSRSRLFALVLEVAIAREAS